MKTFRIGIALIVWLLLSIPSALATEKTMAQIALDNSPFSEYEIVLHSQDGKYSAFLATQKDGTKPLFAIVETTQDVPSMVLWYLDFLPSDWCIDTTTLVIHDASKEWLLPGVTLTDENSQKDRYLSLSLFKKDHQWCMWHLRGQLDEMQYSIDISEQNYFCWSDAQNDGCFIASVDLPLAAEFFSIEAILCSARDALWENREKEQEQVAQTLQKAFPKESFSTQNFIKWHLYTNEGTTVTLALMEKNNYFPFYAVVDTPLGRRSLASITLLPIQTLEDAQTFDLHYYPAEIDPLELWFHGTIGQTSYEFCIIQNDHGDLEIPCIYGYLEDNSMFRLELKGERIAISGFESPWVMSIYAQCPPRLQDIHTFNVWKLFDLSKQTYEDWLQNVAPVIPIAQETPRFPQPCEASLKTGKFDVYTGPGTQYYREASGKAQVSTNDWVQVFGRDGDYALIQYHISDGLFRFGYIHKNAFQNFKSLPLLSFDDTPLVGDHEMCTSNPLGRAGKVDLGLGEKHFTILAHLDAHWMYASVTMPNGQPARMFIEKKPGHG